MGPDTDADRPLQVGDVMVHERTLEEADISAFGTLTGDQGAHHLAAPGRLPIAQGLLVASLPTKLGGDLSFLGRSMHLEFLGPVQAGERVRSEVRLDDAARTARGWRALLTSTVRRANGDLVLRGEADGFLPGPAVEAPAQLRSFRVRAGLEDDASLVDVVNAVAAIPYGRAPGRAGGDALAAWRGTCSTKHYLLRALLDEGWPEIHVETWHRVYRVGREWAASVFGQAAGASVPEQGLMDVHTYLVARLGQDTRTLDVTFPLARPWAGSGPMDLRCGDGLDVPGGVFPDRTKRSLVALHCDPQAREAFIAGLATAAQGIRSAPPV